MDTMFPLATTGDSGGAAWSCPIPRRKPGITIKRPGKRTLLRVLAGTVMTPDASARELKNHEFSILLEMCLQTAMAMTSNIVYMDFAYDCMLHLESGCSLWAKKTLRRDMIIRAASLAGNMFSVPKTSISRADRRTPTPKEDVCSCTEEEKISFLFTAAEGHGPEEFDFGPDGKLGASARGERRMYTKQPLWSFAFLALMAIDPTFDLSRNMSLPCVRCKSSFDSPRLQTLRDCLTRISTSSVTDILKGLSSECKWAQGILGARRS
jgi:hypothetical protein